MAPKVLVGCPTAEPKAYCLNDYAASLKKLTYPSFDVLLVDNSPKPEYADRIRSLGIPVVKDAYIQPLHARIVHSRNILRQHALDNGYDYLFSLEQDVLAPPDIIQRLLAHGKDIVTGIYYGILNINGQTKQRPLAWAAVPGQPDQMRFITTEASAGVANPALIKLKACGLGCVLISRRVLEKIPFRYPSDLTTYDDIAFCNDAAKNNFDIYADTGAHCDHIIGGDHVTGTKY